MNTDKSQVSPETVRGENGTAENPVQEEAVSPTLVFRVLGGLSMSLGGVDRPLNFKRSRQLRTLLETLVSSRGARLSAEQLCELLWADGDAGGADDPLNALKNLVWRCRKVLREALAEPFADALIIYENGTYSLNESLDIVVDVDEMETLHRGLAATTGNIDLRTHMLRQLIGWYRGDFLQDVSTGGWVEIRRAYYKRMYVDAVVELLDHYKRSGLYESMLSLCEEALSHESFSEPIHSAYIHALVRTNRGDRAIAHYEATNKRFYRELGVGLSAKMSAVYHQLQTAVTGRDVSASQVLLDLDEQSSKPGGFYCDYEVLKNIYRVCFRSIRRSRQSVSVITISIQGALSKLDVMAMMDELKDCISHCLRGADSFARSCANQYLVVLPNATEVGSRSVCERVRRASQRLCHKYHAEVRFTTAVRNCYRENDLQESQLKASAPPHSAALLNG